MKKIHLMVVLFGVAALIAGCGGGGGDDDDDSSGAALTLSATIDAPTVSSNISVKSLSSKVVAADVECYFYTLEGDVLGSDTTDENGLVQLPLETLTDFIDTGDSTDAYEVGYLIVCDNGIACFNEGNNDDVNAETAVLDGGTCNANTTFAWSMMLNEILAVYPDWELGQPLDLTEFEAAHPCFFGSYLMHLATFEDISWDGSGMSDDLAPIYAAMEAILMAGGDISGFEDFGEYDSPADLFADLLQNDEGEDDSGLWQHTEDFADDYVPDEYDAYLENAADAVEYMEAIDEMYDGLWEEDGYGMMGFIITFVESPDTATSTECSEIESGESDAGFFAGTFISFDDPASMEQAMGGDCAAVIFGMEEEGLEMEAAGTDTSLLDNPAAMAGFIEQYGGDCSSLFSDGDFVDSTMLDDMFGAMENCADEATVEEMMACSEQMHGLVYEGGGGDWSEFADEGSWDYWEGIMDMQCDDDVSGCGDIDWEDNWSDYGGEHMTDNPCMDPSLTMEEREACLQAQYDGLDEGPPIDEGFPVPLASGCVPACGSAINAMPVGECGTCLTTYCMIPDNTTQPVCDAFF